MSDTEIDLKWDEYVGIPFIATFEICWNTLTPVCVNGPVSVVQCDMKCTNIMYVLYSAREKLIESLIIKFWPGKCWHIYSGFNI